ncbi:dihydrodipicolinate synthase family protein [Arthrobacter sp. JZ12]|uniref:dihydrodipicolinate synthase family protein n=1 Tax=Arthrobacter sp. JZ12 TaxID=2654190 RepID=UPI002B47C571|nr:dihydrodipicolinate synthase family protein [Arthrobacter sp. JZ12]WRH24213.1 dihydrodipicolinate synthase family protein [Arthrobacter sp. JZ12]
MATGRGTLRKSLPEAPAAKTSELTGVFTALITPYTAEGHVDERSLPRLVDRSIDSGVDGVVACGSSGEFAALSHQDRRFVVERVVDQAAGRVPVIAQTGAISTAEAIALTQHAEAVGASTAMVITPYYDALPAAEVEHYLRDVAGSVSIPIKIYNYPAATGLNLMPETVGKLAQEVPNIRYIKDTSGDLAQARGLVRDYGDIISTFIGWDPLALDALLLGAAGVMVGTANVVPSQFVSIRHAVLAGDVERAREDWQQIRALVEAISNAPFAPAVKAALEVEGFRAGDSRKPLLGLDQQNSTAVEAAARSRLLPHAS